MSHKPQHLWSHKNLNISGATTCLVTNCSRTSAQVWDMTSKEREKGSIDRMRISSGFAACYTREGCWVGLVHSRLILIDEFTEVFVSCDSVVLEI
jgi:hypothetical protein